MLEYNYLKNDLSNVDDEAFKNKLGDILNIQHTHENKEILDTITQENIDRWNQGGSGTVVDSTQIMGLQYYDDADIVPSEQSLFTFTVNNNGTTATLSGVTGETISGNIVIPYKYTDENGNEYIVTDIGDYAFSNVQEDYLDVVIPKSVRVIGMGAFEYCSLSSVIMFDGLRTIKDSAFAYCRPLSLSIPSTVTSIDGYAFSDSDMGGHITIPDNVTVIQSSTFYNTQIESIQLPKNLKRIEEWAFKSCYYLTQIEIPDSVTHIGDEAFDECGDYVEGAEFTIICSPGSYAEKYAKENGIKYKYTITDIVATSVITSLNGESVILEHNQDLRISTTVLNIHTPNEIPENYYSLLTLAPSETQITLTFSGEPITWRGDDVDSNGVFIPELNTMYRIAFELVYTNIDDEGNTTYTIVARVGVV